MRVLFCPDLGQAIGSGHAMRDLAVAEALVAGGDEVVYACDTTGLDWVEQAIVERGVQVVPAAAGPADLAQRLGADAVVIDSYTLPTAAYAAVQARRVPLVAVVDGHRRGAVADVLVDPSPGGPEGWKADLAAGQRLLVGADYALVRHEFRSRRPLPREEAAPLRVLVTFGGTDVHGLAPTLAAAVLALGLPIDLSVVVRPELRESVQRLPVGPGQRLRAVPPGSGFPDLVHSHDLVLSAAGSTSWELLAMGAATGLICVADNQERYYRALPAAGVALAVGTLADLTETSPDVQGPLRSLLVDHGLRATLRASAVEVVDGLGGERVAARIRRLGREATATSRVSP